MIKHAYLIEARGHPGHDVIRNFYQSQGLEDGKIYDRQKNCIDEDEWVTKKVKDKNGDYFEQKGWQGGDGKNTINLQQIIQGTYAQMVSTFPILRTEGHKFTPGVATMWSKDEFGMMFENENTNAFNEILKMLVKFHKNDYDGYLRRIRKNKNQIELIDKDTPTTEELINRFSQARAEDIQATKNKINSKEYTNTKYFIKPITEYDDLLRYEELCYPENIWCLMEGEDAWNSYTKNELYQFYLVLDKRLCDENGDPILENKDVIPAEQGKGHPNDEYGLSMMGIIVDMDGELAYCTSRWNHAGKGDDHTMNAEEISNTLGVNFYQTFKPNTKFQDSLNKALEYYHENDSLEWFDYYEEQEEDSNIYEVNIEDLCNFINLDTGELLSEKWFDIVKEFHNGFSRVKIKNKGWNFINCNGKLISNIWFKSVKDFENGVVNVMVENKGWNIMNTRGELLSQFWFGKPYNKNKKLNSIFSNEKGYNFINDRYEIVSDIWFDDIIYNEDYEEELIEVWKKGKGWNFLNSDGELCSDEWFETLMHHASYMIGLYSYSDKTCKLFKLPNKKPLFGNTIFKLKLRYSGISFFSMICIELNGKFNFINEYGKLVSSIWFDDVKEIENQNGYRYDEYQVTINNEGSYLIDIKGNLYDIENYTLVKNVSPQQDGEQITNESLRRKYAKELNEVLDLNKRIKKLYE